LTERAQVYAIALGIEIGGEAASPEPTSLPPTPVQVEAVVPEAQAAALPAAEQPDQAEVCSPLDTQLAVDDPNMVDYAQRYNQIVLGEQPVNWGNMVLIGLIALVALGGGGFVVFNEMRLSRSSIETAVLQGEYPAEAVETLLSIARLKTRSQKSLQHILSNPEKADKVLGLIDEVVSDSKPQE
jgi:hypothetical protein